MGDEATNQPIEPVLARAKQGEIILRVANSTDVHKLATAIQRNVEEGSRVVLSCVGVQTVNQAMKSLTITNGRVAPYGYVLLALPTFHMEKLENDAEHTVMRFILIKHMIGS